jgi:processive 1,2-diacylglycerol beta-glucosyltransferase
MPRPPRILVLTATIGAGHDLPAELLADAIRARGGEAEVVDGLKATGRVVNRIVTSSAEGPGFDISYWLASRFPPGAWVVDRLSWLVGWRAMRRVVGAYDADVVVSTYPGFNPVLGRLHRHGTIHPPIVSAITDLAALRYWAHPDLALHLITHAESADEVRAIAGASTAIAQVSGFSDPAFLEPTDQPAMRAALELPADGPIVVVSGGGWGVGDLEGGVRVALEVPGLTVVALCGTNAELRTRLERAFAGEPRVRVWGFTDRMSDLLGAADVLVHSTAGLTVLEAQIRGTRVISYGWGKGHIRLNNRAYEELDMAAVARTAAQLRAALVDALAHPVAPDDALRALPAAADEVLALAAAERR